MSNKKFIVRFVDTELLLKVKSLKEGKYEDKKLFNSITNSIRKIEENPFDSILIKKSQIPKLYVQKHNISNLRVYKINQNWRLIFSIVSNEVQIISIILEYLNHKEYEKRFHYKVK